MPQKQHTDTQIINGLQAYDEDMTKRYFYGYCRNAYRIFDHKFGLSNKAGLDFYSLAHDYYIRLLTHNFKQLREKPSDVSLSTWVVGGFRFVVLDALKAHNKEAEHQTEAQADEVLEYVRSDNHEIGLLDNVAEAVANHYHDRIMQEIAYMIIYAGFKQKDVAERLGMTPAAVNQRYKRMMEEVVTPFVIENYPGGTYIGDDATATTATPMGIAMPVYDNISNKNFMSDNDSYMLTTESNGLPSGRITPDFITSLKDNEIFVFGSNLHGIHAGGAARMALANFGAVMGNGNGIQGRSYAIPTMQGGVETIKPYVDEFLKFASSHPELHFLVTPIGCGIAGFEPQDIAPLFAEALSMENVSLPQSFVECI